MLMLEVKRWFISLALMKKNFRFNQKFDVDVYTIKLKAIS